MPGERFVLIPLLFKNPIVKHNNKIENGRNVHEYQEDPSLLKTLNPSIKRNRVKKYDTIPKIFNIKSDKTDPK